MEANDVMNNNYKRLTIVNTFKKHTIEMFGFYIAVLIATAQEVEFTAATPYTKIP